MFICKNKGLEKRKLWILEVWRTWKEVLRGRERRNNAVLIFSLETKANEKLFFVSLASRKEFFKTAALGPLLYINAFHFPFSSLRWLLSWTDTKATVSLRQRHFLTVNVGKRKDPWLYQMLGLHKTHHHLKSQGALKKGER